MRRRHLAMAAFILVGMIVLGGWLVFSVWFAEPSVAP